VSPQFSIKAGWPDGSVAEESILAPDSKAAQVEIERRGGHVFEVRRHGLVLPGGRRSGKKGRIKMADFLVFNQEIIALLKAGLPVVRSFEILLERQESPALRAVLADVKDRVNSGASISEAFAEQGDLFPRLYWTSLKAGEKSGEIESVLRRYLKYQKTVMAISRKVVSTLVYPAILMLLSAVLITILMTVVIPKFQDFFADFQADLPLLTVIVVGIAGFLRDNALWLGKRRITARTVTIKVRYSDFVTITRSHSDQPTNDPDGIVQRAVALIEKTEAGLRPVRLLGAGVHNLESLAERGAGDILQLRLET